MDKKKTYIDLFAGCGGLSLGLYNSGMWEGKFAIEKNTDAFKTLQHNLINNKKHFDWPAWLPQSNHDIRYVIKKFGTELKSLRGSVDMIAGGPPCQGFSKAGRRDETDSRNKLINSYVEFIRLVQPKVIFFENVRGFTQKFNKNKKKGKIYSQYVMNALARSNKRLNSVGYQVTGHLIDFSEYGVPQKRTRFILVGIRKDLVSEKKPEQFFEDIIQNREVFLASKGLELTTSLQEAISDLLRGDEQPCLDYPSFKTSSYGRSSSAYQKLMRGGRRKLPDSHRFAKHSNETTERFSYILEHAERGKTLSREIKNQFNLKKRTIIPSNPATPTPTITTLPDDYIHYSQPRIFTVREYARIQSFNDWYEIKGKYTTGGKRRVHEVPRYSQIGNAIPPLFGEQAAKSLAKLV